MPTKPLQNNKIKARGKTLNLRDLSTGFCVSTFDWVIGVDEVGAGCLAGPVVAAAYAYPLHEQCLESEIPVRVFDSKILPENIRNDSAAWLQQWPQGLYEICEVSNEEIDRINILRARFKAMSLGIESLLKKIPEKSKVGIFVDGSILPPEITKFHSGNINSVAITKGDAKVFAIAAASIVAKTYRDQLMQRFSKDFPHFGWSTNVGYPTPEHKAAIKQHGHTPLHRRSFAS